MWDQNILLEGGMSRKSRPGQIYLACMKNVEGDARGMRLLVGLGTSLQQEACSGNLARRKFICAIIARR